MPKDNYIPRAGLPRIARAPVTPNRRKAPPADQADAALMKATAPISAEEWTTLGDTMRDLAESLEGDPRNDADRIAYERLADKCHLRAGAVRMIGG